MKLNTTPMMPPESALIPPSVVHLADGTTIYPNGKFPVDIPIAHVSSLLNAGWYVVPPPPNWSPPDAQ